MDADEIERRLTQALRDIIKPPAFSESESVHVAEFGALIRRFKVASKDTTEFAAVNLALALRLAEQSVRLDKIESRLTTVLDELAKRSLVH